MTNSLKHKAIVIDVDDTILDFGSRVREFYNHDYGKRITGLSEKWGLDEWLNIDKELASAVLADFMDNWQFGVLDPLPGAKRVLTRIAQQGYDIFVVTACGTDPQVMALRKANLYHCFGNIFEEVVFVPY